MSRRDASPDREEARRQARRKLLRLAVYLPPAILGTFAVTRTAEALSCLPAYGCAPNICQPNTCAPDLCQPWVCTPPP
ncbi:MAG: hypothetical protein L0216_20710 [Planctomycetales bacterium]|nr:hypothetical protein [Planctomycetales bacterium]